MVYVITSSSIKAISFLMLLLVASTSSQSSNNTICPQIDRTVWFEAGFYDTGNAVAIGGSQLPAANPPYGITFPGGPTGRWSDGRVFPDVAGPALGVRRVANYLAPNSSTADVVVFAVARSPILNSSFFQSNGIQNIPNYTVPLSGQQSWFRTYLDTKFPTPTARATGLSRTLVVYGNVEANDIIYALFQGKSVQEVQSYIPIINQARINAARESIRLGATKIIITGSAPMGCFPFVLTELASNNLLDYDINGCLISVNNLMIALNADLLQAVTRLQREFPNVFILYFPVYEVELLLIRTTLIPGNLLSPIRSCCGIGGRYNYDKNRFCGSPGVPVCSDPSNYFFWDGIHLTDAAYKKFVALVRIPTLLLLNCTIV